MRAMTVPMILAACAGHGVAVAADLQPLEARRLAGPSIHLYQSPSGERVLLTDGASPRVGEIDQWSYPSGGAGNGFFTSLVEPNALVGTNSGAFGYAAARDWGDLYPDTVVDSFTVSFATGYRDPTPNDTIMDDVIGNNFIIRFEDAQGGGDDLVNAGSQPLIAIQISDIPAGPDTGDSNTLSGFTVTIDLGDASFELGDSNGQPEEACVGDDINLNSFADLDNDSLHDFSFDVYFQQPGVDPHDPSTYANAVAQGVALGAPSCDQFPGPYPIPGPAGSEDALVRFDLTNTTAFDLFDEQDSAYAGQFGGGFSCDNGVPSGVYGGIDLKLYGPTPGTCGDDGICRVRLCNPADLAPPCGSLTFADITTFLTAFNDMDPIADFEAPAGEYTFADIAAFLNAFVFGCP
jgi:hypothetical protein